MRRQDELYVIAVRDELVELKLADQFISLCDKETDADVKYAYLCEIGVFDELDCEDFDTAMMSRLEEITRAASY